MTTHSTYVRLKKDYARAVWLIVILMLLVACQPITRTSPQTPVPLLDCSSLSTEIVGELFHADLRADEIDRWLAKRFNIPETSINYQEQGQISSSGVVPAYYWSTDVSDYVLALREGIPIFYTQEWPLHVLSLAKTLQCLGEPDLYVADYRQSFESMAPSVILYAAYPKLGILLRLDVHNLEGEESPGATFKMPERTTSTGIYALTMYNLEETGEEWFDALFGYRFNFGQTPEDEVRRAWYSEMLRPWPDDVSNLVYEVVPGP
jgi:hypothetical protein